MLVLPSVITKIFFHCLAIVIIFCVLCTLIVTCSLLIVRYLSSYSRPFSWAVSSVKNRLTFRVLEPINDVLCGVISLEFLPYCLWIRVTCVNFLFNYKNHSSERSLNACFAPGVCDYVREFWWSDLSIPVHLFAQGHFAILKWNFGVTVWTCFIEN